MFNGLKKRVSSALQEGRNLSENLANTYIRQSSSSSSSSTASTATSPSNHSTTAATPTIPPPTSTNTSKYSLHNALTSLPSFTRGLASGHAAADVVAAPLPADINPYAGCEHLAAQEAAWQELHDAHVQNASIADELDATILELRKRSERTATAVSDMQHSLLALPAIGEQLRECRRMMVAVAEDSERLAGALLELEDVQEELELQERQFQLNIDLSVYRDEKMVDLERVRSALVHEHAAKQRDHEQRLRSVQLERQAVFQQAFQDDLQSYRTLGTIPKVERPKPDLHGNAAIDSVVALEEIVLDAATDDTQKLDEFLNN